jgi:hypothetical protein
LGDLVRHGAEPPPASFVTRSRCYVWLIVGVTCIGAFMGQLDASIVQLALPTLGRVFDTSLESVSWVSLGYLLAFASFLPSESNEIQENPKKSKEIGRESNEKKLGFVWISLDSFVRFGAFQWVSRENSKKCFSSLSSVGPCGDARPSLSRREDKTTMFSAFRQAIVDLRISLAKLRDCLHGSERRTHLPRPPPGAHGADRISAGRQSTIASASISTS